MCVGVQCFKTCCLVINFTTGVIFDQKEGPGLAANPAHLFIVPPCSVCFLHLFLFRCVLQYPVAIEHMTEDLEFVREGQLALTSRCVDHQVLGLLLCIRACPPHARKF